MAQTTPTYSLYFAWKNMGFIAQCIKHSVQYKYYIHKCDATELQTCDKGQ